MNGTRNLLVPPFRKLTGYAFDPSLSLKIGTVGINQVIYKVPWEEELLTGPIGEYLEVVDFDPTMNKFYQPVNLNDSFILAQDGLPPSESNPQFHQQMVYAVCMTTIKNFEKALGRPVLWSPHATSIAEIRQLENTSTKKVSEQKTKYEFVQRLRVYPHAMREANAYYSPQKKALLFGYFSAQPADITIQMPNSLVFTCLSHDIIAHETTHAILDGMYRRYTEATNIDVLAFHEAFADIVALFQHFSFPEVLKHQIAQTRGDLSAQSLLGQLAQEFGTAIGHYGALRDAIGEIDIETHQWRLKIPHGDEYQTVTEAHDRGAILVSALFDAFLTIYKNRVQSLLRVSSGGTGILPQGELQTDLVDLMAAEAAKSASHVLGMCIRALDFCPPVDITFGDYLRAIITADADLLSEDPLNYRICFIDAFRKRGIYPTGIRNLSVESLCYPRLTPQKLNNISVQLDIISKFLREFHRDLLYVTKREDLYTITGHYIRGKYDDKKNVINGLHRRLNQKFLDSQTFQELTGLIFNQYWRSLGIDTSKVNGASPSFEVHTLKLAERVGPNGNKSNQIILSLIQRSGIEVIRTTPEGKTQLTLFPPSEDNNLSGERFIMTGGCTLVFDLQHMELKYAISKPLLDVDLLKNEGKYQIDVTRAKKIKDSLHGAEGISAYEAYFSRGRKFTGNEPFSFLHQN